MEREALSALEARSPRLKPAPRPRSCKRVLYDVGRSIPRYQDFAAKGATPEKPGVSNAWFNAIYEVLLGESQGPRFGSFIALYGIEETRELIDARSRESSQGGVSARPRTP